mmetsp:Transcript_24346/g.34047  ORF Transcript_24346/g.34047 Transcript_24346/m.34047 type:complete len:465 (+) Transcript_24346:3086-4480(+)
MKKLLTLIVALTVVVASCDDQLLIPPVDALDAGSVFETVADLEVGMNGLYGGYNAQSYIRHTSIFTDETKVGANNGGQGITLHNWIVDPGSNAAGIWNSHYNTISFANRILEASAGITPAGADETTRFNTVVAEAKAWRAFAHFWLLAAYAPDFEAGTIGVPYVTDVIVLEQPARNTVGEVFAGMKADLNEAAASIAAGVGSNRWNQDAINALLARIAIYEGDNATALSLSNALVTSYGLADRTQYTETFTDLGNTEVIMELVQTQNDGRIGGIWFFTGTGGAFFEMSNGLFNVLDAGDIRTDVLFDASVSDPANNLHLIGKYLGKDGFDYLNDIKLFRSAEMQLIKAEAQAKTGDLNGAAATVKELRDARYGAAQALPNYANLNAALTDIMAERRLELAFEGHRFFDLKRIRQTTQQSLSRDALDCGNGGTPCNLELSDPRWAIAIPAGEIDANPNMVQNPGY